MLDKYEESLNNLKELLETFSEHIIKAVNECEEGVNFLDVDKFVEVKETLKNVENIANETDQSIVRILALYTPEAVELREIVAFLKITAELVRVSDNIKSFSKRMAGHIRNEVDFSTVQEYSTHLAKSAFNALKFSIDSIKAHSKDEARNLYRDACVEESQTDDLYSILQKNIMSELCKDIDKSAESIEVLSTMRKLERMADRSVNITKLMLFARAGGEIQQFG